MNALKTFKISAPFNRSTNAGCLLSLKQGLQLCGGLGTRMLEWIIHEIASATRNAEIQETWIAAFAAMTHEGL
jgi:hypothetical protein